MHPQEHQAHEATRAALARSELDTQHAHQRCADIQRQLLEQVQHNDGQRAHIDALSQEVGALRQQLHQQQHRALTLEGELKTVSDGFAAQAPSIAALEKLLLGQEVPNGDEVLRKQNKLLLDRVRVLEQEEHDAAVRWLCVVAVSIPSIPSIPSVPSIPSIPSIPQ